MKGGLYFFIFIAITLFIGINYYIGLRGWQTIGSIIPIVNSKAYWIFFWMLAASYVVARIGDKFLPEGISNFIAIVGAYWMAATLYFILIIPFVDVVRFVGKRAKFVPEMIKNNRIIGNTYGFIILFFVIALLIYGTYNAQKVKVVSYNLNINKKSEALDKLKIIMVSDIHLGNIVDNKRLEKMVEEINDRKPDLVLLAGDIIDERLEPFIKQNMGDTFLKLKANLGVYGVLGNHEYIGGEAEAIVPALEKSGIKMLKDNYVKVNDSFYIVGRDDASAVRFNNKNKRKSLGDILQGVDKELPVIIMDHQPVNLKETEENGVDIQFSGHTHRGQMFPSQFITEKIFEIDWGYLKKGNSNIIVSSGYGTWGPPIRIGNSSEIVEVNIKFSR